MLVPYLHPRVESLMSRVYVLGHVGNYSLTLIGILLKNLQYNKIYHFSMGSKTNDKITKSVLSAQGVTKGCCLSWLNNSTLLYEPKCGGGCELRGLTANEYSCAHGAQINLGFNLCIMGSYVQRGIAECNSSGNGTGSSTGRCAGAFLHVWRSSPGLLTTANHRLDDLC